jgi:hypothetical protein
LTVTRVLQGAIIAAGVGLTVALLTSGSAAASALADGLYRFDFDGSKQTLDGNPNPTKPYTTMVAIRSACLPGGCVATATDLEIGAHALQPPYEGTYVFRESSDQWGMSRYRMYMCNNGMTQGSETQSFQVRTGGTLVGVSTQLQAPCAPIVVPFTATRVADLPPNVEVADPSTV